MSYRKPSVACGLLLLLLAASCSSDPKKESKYPERKPGCELQVYTDDHLPTYKTDNIGPVSASCDPSIADAECMRTLKDEACKLGADTLWGVNETATMQTGKKRFFGRAAHQK